VRLIAGRGCTHHPVWNTISHDWWKIRAGRWSKTLSHRWCAAIVQSNLRRCLLSAKTALERPSAVPVLATPARISDLGPEVVIQFEIGKRSRAMGGNRCSLEHHKLRERRHPCILSDAYARTSGRWPNLAELCHWDFGHRGAGRNREALLSDLQWYRGGPSPHDSRRRSIGHRGQAHICHEDRARLSFRLRRSESAGAILCVSRHRAISVRR